MVRIHALQPRGRVVHAMSVPVLIGALFGIPSCDERQGGLGPSTEIARSSASAERGGRVRLPDVDPVVSKWDGGAHLAGVKPSVLFAAWRDGTVLRRTDRGLMVGRAGKADIEQLLEIVRSAGFFDDRKLRELIVPDGPQLVITASAGERAAVLRYHGRQDWLDVEDIDESASPSRAEVTEFMQLWTTVNEAIASLEVELGQEYHGAVILDYPG
jgi:hypothetical protein